MKKIKLLAGIACIASLLGMTSCEDVPAPYSINDGPIVVIRPAGAGTADNPYNVAALDSLFKRDLVPSGGLKVYARGIVSKTPEIDVSYGNATYYISDNGKTTKQFEIYRGLYLNGAKFTSSDQLLMGDTVLVYGTIVNYNGTKEFTTGSTIVKKGGDIPVPTPVKPTPSYKDFTNGSFETWAETETGLLPVGWDGSLTRVEVTRSTDAKFGSYAAQVAPPSANVHLATTNLKFPVGEYKISYWAKAIGEGIAQTRPGIAKYTAGEYGKGVYSTLETLDTNWKQIEGTFEIDEEGDYSVLIQFANKNTIDALVDEFTIEKIE